MRFGFVHRLLIDALAALGLLALLTGGQLDPTVAVLGGVVMLLVMLIPERYQDHAVLRHGGTAASLALLLLQTMRAAGGGELLPIAVEFAAGLQLVRLATRRGAAHDQQIIMLALLHLVAGAVLGVGLSYALCFIGFLTIAPAALVLSHLRREVEGNYRQGARDRTGLPVDVPRILRSRRVISRQFLWATCALSVPVILFTAVLFVLFPRVGFSLFALHPSRATRMVGFSDRVDLGSVGKLRSDPTIALRLRYINQPPEPPPRLALYLRGTAFDEYQAGVWLRSQTSHTLLEPSATVWLSEPQRSAAAMNVELEPISPPVIFLPNDAVGFRVERGLQPSRPLQILDGADGEFQYQNPEEHGLRYTVLLGRPSPSPLPTSERGHYLSVPQDVRGPLATLAATWAAGLQGDRAIAEEFERRLRAEYRYDLDSPSSGAAQPLLHFLFESKAGHCEFYSTAMALLLRTLDIPTRNVTGFIGGTYNRFGDFYAVRQGDAHSWIEAYLDGRGWTRFDPTPPSEAIAVGQVDGALAFMRDAVEAAAQRWSRYVVGYNLDQQVGMIDALRRRSEAEAGKLGYALRRLGVVLLGFALCLGGYWWWRQRHGRLSDGKQGAPQQLVRTAELYRQLEDVLRVMGAARAPATPPLAHAQRLVADRHPSAAEVLALTRIYLESRFGGRELSVAEQGDFEGRVQRLRVTAPRAT